MRSRPLPGATLPAPRLFLPLARLYAGSRLWRGGPVRMTGVSDRVKRFLLAALMALLVLNLWTGGPLLALWLGSRVQGEGPPKMGAIGVVILALVVISVGALPGAPGHHPGL